MRHALAFAKDQHKALVRKHHEQAEWQRRFGAAKARELNQLSGEDFEEYLAGVAQNTVKPFTGMKWRSSKEIRSLKIT